MVQSEVDHGQVSSFTSLGSADPDLCMTMSSHVTMASAALRGDVRRSRKSHICGLTLSPVKGRAQQIAQMVSPRYSPHLLSIVPWPV